MAIPAVGAAVVTSARGAVSYAAKNSPALLEKARNALVNGKGVPAANDVKAFARLAASGPAPAVAVLEQLARAGIRPDILLADVSPEFMSHPEMVSLRESLYRVHNVLATQANDRGGSTGVDRDSVLQVRAVNDEIRNAMAKLGVRTSKDLWSIIKVLRVVTEADLENFRILEGR